jgi:hypothetical protein
MIINANDQYIGRSIEVYKSWAQDDIDLIKSLIDLLLTTKKKRLCFMMWVPTLVPTLWP